MFVPKRLTTTRWERLRPPPADTVSVVDSYSNRQYVYVPTQPYAFYGNVRSFLPANAAAVKQSLTERILPPWRRVVPPGAKAMIKKKKVIVGSTFKGKIRSQQPTNLSVMVPPSPKRPEIQKPSKQRTGRRNNLHKSSVIRNQNEKSFIFIAASNQEEEGNEVDVELALLNHGTSMSTMAISENGNSDTVVEDITVLATSRRSSLINTLPIASSSSPTADENENVGDDTGTDDMNNQGQHGNLTLVIPEDSPPKSGTKLSEKQPSTSTSQKISSSSPSSLSLSQKYPGTKRSLILHRESFMDLQAQEQEELVAAATAMKTVDNVDADNSDDDPEQDEQETKPLTLRKAFQHISKEKKQKSGMNTPTSPEEEEIPDSIAAAVSCTVKSLRGGVGVDGMDIPETDSPLPLDEEAVGSSATEGEDRSDGKPKKKRTISFHGSTKEGVDVLPSGSGSRQGSSNDPLSPGGRRSSRSRKSSTDHRRSSKDQLRASVIERLNNIAADTASRTRRNSMQLLLAITAATTDTGSGSGSRAGSFLGLTLVEEGDNNGEDLDVAASTKGFPSPLVGPTPTSHSQKGSPARGHDHTEEEEDFRLPDMILHNPDMDRSEAVSVSGLSSGLLVLQHKLKDKKRAHGGKIHVEEGEGGMSTEGSVSTTGSVSSKVNRPNIVLSIRRPRISNKDDVFEVSEEALQAAAKPALGFSISDPHGVIDKMKRRAARAENDGGGRMFELLGMETGVDDLRHANKANIQARRQQFSNLLGALEGDEGDEDDESYCMSESGSEASLGPGQFSLRGSLDLTTLGLHEDMLANLQEIKEKVMEKPPPAVGFHGRGGKNVVAEVNVITEEMKMLALRKIEVEERRRHERGKKEYLDYLKKYEQQMIALATLPDATAHVIMQQQQQQQQQQQHEDPGQPQDNSADDGHDGNSPYQGVNDGHRDDVSLLRPQIIPQTAWGGTLLQAYLTRHHTSQPTSSYAVTTNVTDTTIITSATSAGGDDTDVRSRAGGQGSNPLSALAATKGSLMPPLSELFFQNVPTSIIGGSDENQNHGLDGVHNNGQPPLQPQPPNKPANKGGRIVSIATARRKYAEANKSVVMERKRQQAYHEALHQTVVVLTPDGHDHGDKGITGPEQGSTGHHPPSHVHRRHMQKVIVEGGETKPSSRGAQEGIQTKATVSEVETSNSGFAFTYAEKYWRAKDATSGVLQQPLPPAYQSTNEAFHALATAALRTGTMLVPMDRVHGKFNASENMQVCLIDDVEEEQEQVDDDDDDDDEMKDPRRKLGVEDVPLVDGAPSDRFRMGCGLLTGIASIPTAAMGLPTAPSNLQNWHPPSEQNHPRPGSKTTTHPTDPSKLLVLTPGKEKIQRERDRKFRNGKQMPLSTRSVAIPPSASTTQRRPIPSESYRRMMGMTENVHGQTKDEMNVDAMNGGNAHSGSNATGENAVHRVSTLTPQVPRIVPRFMSGKHLRGMGEGYQRRFTPKTFYIPGEEPSHPSPPSPSKLKQEDEEDDGEVHALMSDAELTKDPTGEDGSPSHLRSKINADDDDDDENKIPLAPIWERPTRSSIASVRNKQSSFHSINNSQSPSRSSSFLQSAHHRAGSPTQQTGSPSPGASRSVSPIIMEMTPGITLGLNEKKRTDSPTSIISTPTKSTNIMAMKTLVPLSDEGLGDEDGALEEGDDEQEGKQNNSKTTKQTHDDDDDDEEEDDNGDDHTKHEKSVGGDESSSDDDED